MQAPEHLPASAGILFDNNLAPDASQPVDVPARARPALEALFELEHTMNQLAGRTIQKNRFWRAMLERPSKISERIFVGTVIENYHFLRHEPYFDGPALTYPGSRAVRELFNHFYCDELGHDKMLAKALEAVGISQSQLDRIVPLPETAALINCLSYWARYETRTFFATVGILEGRERKLDSFVSACEAKPMPPAFVKPVRAHALINVQSGHGGLSRLLFRELGGIAEEELARMRTNIPLFVDLYDRFYSAIWSHYGNPRKPLLRTVDWFES